MIGNKVNLNLLYEEKNMKTSTSVFLSMNMNFTHCSHVMINFVSCWHRTQLQNYILSVALKVFCKYG